MMPRLMLVAMICAGLAGCGGNPSLERHQQLVALLNEVTDILATVNDKASADEARPKLVSVGEKIREVYRTQRLSKDTGMDLENIKYDKKYAKELEEVNAAREGYGKESARVLSLPTPEGAILVRTINAYVYPSTVR
jgi:hypothetical protein